MLIMLVFPLPQQPPSKHVIELLLLLLTFTKPWFDIAIKLLFECVEFVIDEIESIFFFLKYYCQ